MFFKPKIGGIALWCTSLRLRWNEFAAWDPGSWMCQCRSHSRGRPDGRAVEYWRWKNQAYVEVISTDRCETVSPETSLKVPLENCLCENVHLTSEFDKKKKGEKIVQNWLRDTLQLCPVGVSASLWKKDQQAETQEFAHVDKSAMGSIQK